MYINSLDGIFGTINCQTWVCLSMDCHVIPQNVAYLHS